MLINRQLCDNYIQACVGLVPSALVPEVTEEIYKRLGGDSDTRSWWGGGGVGDTMFTSYTSSCHGRQAASLLVLILQHPHSAVAMVTSSREKAREVKRERKRGRGRRENQKHGERERDSDSEPDCLLPKLIQQH